MLQFCRPITKKRDCVRRWRKMQKLFKRKPDPRKVDSRPDASLFYYFLMDDMMATHRVLTICKNSTVSMGGVRAEAHVARNCKRWKGCFYIPHLSTKIWKTSIKIIPVPLLSLCSLPYMLFWIPHLFIFFNPLSSCFPSKLFHFPRLIHIYVTWAPHWHSSSLLKMNFPSASLKGFSPHRLHDRIFLSLSCNPIFSLFHLEMCKTFHCFASVWNCVIPLLLR